MATLTYNTNIFTDVRKWNVDDNEYSYTGIQLASKINQKNGQDYKLIDAIDIDWNGAFLKHANTYFYNTEDLINFLDGIADSTSSIDNVLERLSKTEDNIELIQATYITYTSLAEELLSYQHSLVAGNHITINNETNEIYTYGLTSNEDIEEILNDYVTQTEFGEYKDYIYNNYPTFEASQEIARNEANTAIKGIVGDADKAFDTIKELSDWIKTQEVYTPVTDIDVFNAILTKYTAGEEHEKLYYQDPNARPIKIDEGEYREIEDYSKLSTEYNAEGNIVFAYTLPDGTVISNLTIYTRRSVAADVGNLIDTVSKLQQTVGDKIVNEDGSISYTGMQLQIENLRIDTTEALDTANEALNISDQALTTANEAKTVANDANAKAEQAIDTANQATETANEALDTANEAIDLAKYVDEEVGKPSVPESYTELTDDEIAAIVEAIQSGTYTGGNIFTKDGDNYVIANRFDLYDKESYYIKGEGDNPDYEGPFYSYSEGIEATGLNKRIEDVEDQVDDLAEKVDEQNGLLYKLDVNNAKSEYVKLSIEPTQYDGTNPERTISISHDTAVFDAESGQLLQDGLPNVTTVNNIMTYCLSWQIFPCIETEPFETYYKEIIPSKDLLYSIIHEIADDKIYYYNNETSTYNYLDYMTAYEYYELVVSDTTSADYKGPFYVFIDSPETEIKYAD